MLWFRRTRGGVEKWKECDVEEKKSDLCQKFITVTKPWVLNRSRYSNAFLNSRFNMCVDRKWHWRYTEKHFKKLHVIRIWFSDSTELRNWLSALYWWKLIKLKDWKGQKYAPSFAWINQGPNCNISNISLLIWTVLGCIT